MIYDPRKQAEILADSFQHRFEPHEEPSQPKFTEEVTQIVKSILQQPTRHTIPVTTPREVHNIIRKIPLQKTAGPDNIPPQALKKLPRRSIIHLTKIYNACFKFIYFPQAWKAAIIIAIHKPGKDPTLPTSYRPISLLDFLGKILEKLLLSRLRPILTAPDVIQNEQFGFKSEHSTREPLVRLTHFIQTGFLSQQHTVATFLDIEQAFDTIWHDGLLYKLQKLSIPDVYIHLIANFLEGRTFQVRYLKQTSTSKPIHAGVPQGSILSPILYSAYVQDIPSHSKCQHALYADDTVIYTKHFNIQYARKHMQEALDKITQWSTRWRLKINNTKSEVVIFTRRFPRINEPLHIQNQAIPFSSTAKYLGVLLDKRLTFKHHIHSVRNRAFQRFMFLYPIFKSSIPTKTKLQLYISVIRSLMMYACEAWSHAHPRHLRRLDGIQRAVCRTITGADYHIRNTQLYRDLNISLFSDYVRTLRKNYLEKLHCHINPLMQELTQ